MAVKVKLDEGVINQVIEATYALPKLEDYAKGGYTTPNTYEFPVVGSQWVPRPQARVMKYGDYNFVVHADGTVHIDPEALVILLDKAKVESGVKVGVVE